MGTPPRVWFRPDATLEVGRGHLSRCRTLAGELAHRRGISCGFIGEGLSPEAALDVERLGFPVLDPAHGAVDAVPPAWVVVDSYALSAAHETELRSLAARVLVIDDLADREHDCDVLLNQNLGASRTQYQRLLPVNCEVLLGPRYALLPAEFAAVRSVSPASRANPVQRVLVCMGGGDVTAATRLVLGALAGLSLEGIEIEVILSEKASGRSELVDLVSQMPRFSMIGLVDDMPERMLNADVFIGAGGTSLWERCALGLPSVTVAIAENQVPSAVAAGEVGATVYAGQLHELDDGLLAGVIKRVLSDAQSRVTMAANSMRVVGDARGASRVADEMLSLRRAGFLLRPLCAEDADMVLAWRNSQRVRTMMRNTAPIKPDEHLAWVASRLADPHSHVLIFEDGKPVGVASLSLQDTEVAEWGVYIGDETAPSGSGSRMGWLALEYAFCQLGLERVIAEVIRANERSLAYHQRMGFEIDSDGGHSTKMSLTRGRWASVRDGLSRQLGLEE